MNRIIKVLLVGLALLGLLSGCGTTPNSNYYLLNSGTLDVPTGSTPSLGIGPIAIPEYLNRNTFIYRRESNKLHINRFERWAEPLDNGIMRILRINLAALLDTQNIQSFPWSSKQRPEYGVGVTIVTLDANESQAVLVAEWHIYRPQSSEVVVRKINRLEQVISANSITASDIERAYSKLFFKLSEIIAREISGDIKNRGKE